MSSKGTVLLTGGFGKTSRQIAQVLLDRGHTTLIASRKGQSGVPEPFKGVQFDWLNKETWQAPFNTDSNIRAIYFVAPPAPNPSTILTEFFELARSKGVKRFVLMGSTQVPRGGVLYGKFHDYLAKSGAEWSVLRPTWFHENFGELFLYSINEKGIIPSATGGKPIAFVSTKDIAIIAANALTDEKSHNKEHYIVGPELLSYDQAAEQLSAVIGRKIIHKQLSKEDAIQSWVQQGFPESLATFLTNMELDVSEGFEERGYAQEGNDIGKVTVKEYFKANKDLWLKK